VILGRRPEASGPFRATREGEGLPGSVAVFRRTG
jgi:hypothetical protein